MINRKALLVVGVVLVTALMLSSLAIPGTVRSEAETGDPDMSIHLYIQGIPGESVAEYHIDWIDIEAFNWSEAASVMIAGRSAGMVSIKDFMFLTRTSKASPKLFLAAATGRIFPHATLECLTSSETNQVKFLEFRFDDAIVTSYNIVGSAPDYRPLDQFSIAFSKITMTYWQITPEGTQGSMITAYYDLTRKQGG